MAEQPLVVVVTGLAGAGRSTAAKVLEDLEFFVIDNLPPKLIGRAAAVADMAEYARSKLALVVDSRSGILTFSELEDEILRLERDGVRTLTVFLDADDRVLVKRYQENRRPHPVKADTLEESIATERELQVVVELIHQLEAEAFGGERTHRRQPQLLRDLPVEDDHGKEAHAVLELVRGAEAEAEQ